VVVTAEVPVRFTHEGENVHVAPAGHPVFASRPTVPANPYRGVTVNVAVPDCPGAEMLMVEVSVEKLKSVTLTVRGAELEAT
jgi:hypothetical protein